MMTRQYLAGIIDGEGCITISGAHYRCRPVIKIRNTSFKMISSIKRQYHDLFQPIRFQVLPSGKKYYLLQASGQKAYDLAKMIRLDLISKKRQAELLIKYFEKVNPQMGYNYSLATRRTQKTIQGRIQALNR